MPSANRASDTLKREESELFLLFAETLILPRKKLTELSKTAVGKAHFNLHCCHLTLNRRFPAPAYLKTLDNDQNFAKAFNGRDFRALMASQKAKSKGFPHTTSSLSAFNVS